MVIENRKTAIGLQKRRFLLLILFTTLVVLLFYIEIFDKAFLGIDRIVYAVVLVAIYLLYYFWGTIRDYNFFYYNDMGVKLIFKYYSLAPLSKRQHSVEIDKSSLYNFQLEKKWFGLRTYLILYQQMAGGIAKYPPISLGLLKNKDVDNLRTSLQLFQKAR